MLFLLAFTYKCFPNFFPGRRSTRPYTVRERRRRRNASAEFISYSNVASGHATRKPQNKTRLKITHTHRSSRQPLDHPTTRHHRPPPTTPRQHSSPALTISARPRTHQRARTRIIMLNILCDRNCLCRLRAARHLRI